jgi:hypothetical protein
MRRIDHQPSPDVHPDVMDGARVPGHRGEEDEVAGQQVRDRDGSATVGVLVRGHAWQQHTCLLVGPPGEPAAVVGVRPDGAPEVRAADLAEREVHGGERLHTRTGISR